ncbi:hypothetical protein GCM10011316_09920 [Roseibium aquae]|uniref:Uncharacterized protein n=1 Tax=Roseibium aquae TaxID=1323746 RepID=A0A916TCC3_9HYPH|nr:hypothetical protein [Roseibium aquae]GGB39900.1 hypothetical protein GCM10011316_09920 [Roseibium aquae]
MYEPKSSATIIALADLAELSADQLESGRSVEEVIALLRRAALAVRETVPVANDDDPFEHDMPCDLDDASGADSGEPDPDGLPVQDEAVADQPDGNPVSIEDELTPIDLTDLTTAESGDPKPISA